MPDYVYTAVLENGKKVSGRFSADSRAAVLDYIYAKGMRPLEVSERKDGVLPQTVKTGMPARRTKGNVEVFLRQIAGLLNAGIPLNRAMDVILREIRHPATRSQWSRIRSDVVGGESLASAFSRWPETFPPVYVAMVRAGETGGFLNVVLEQIADFKLREQDLKGRVKAALIYPALLVVVAAAVMVFLLLYFIPQFALIFEEFGGALPLLTRMIMSFSSWIARYGFFIAIFLVLASMGLKRAFASVSGKRMSEKFLIGIPVLGAVTVKFGLVRFCRMLGTLLESGVSLVASLYVAREAIGNQSLSDTLSDAIDRVKNGVSLARGLSINPKLFPPTVIEMIAVAEESGSLDKELQRISSSYEAELDRQLRMLVAVLEPALLFLMAGLVGVVVIGMLLPVFTLQELIR